MTGEAAPGRGIRQARPVVVPEQGIRELVSSDDAALIASGLDAAMRLRIPWGQAATSEVRRLAVGMCIWLGLDEADQRLVELAATLRDVGMLALPDGVLRPPARLSSRQRAVVCQHPVLGAELLDTLAGLQATAALVRSHHERWDGAGYPDRLAGEATPLLSRVIATADALVTTATEQAHDLPLDVDRVRAQAPRLRGRQCEPLMVDAVLAVLDDGPSAGTIPPHPRAPAPGRRARARTDHRCSGLVAALRALEQLPAFTPSCDRALHAARTPGTAARDLTIAVEGSTGLTVAVLKAAQLVNGGRGIANVPDAIRLLGYRRTSETIAAVPRVPFPAQTAETALLHQVCIHGQAVARAAQRIASEIRLAHSDDLIAAALLHDVGKLLVARLLGPGRRVPVAHAISDQRRIARERHDLGLDHADLGALLIERWGLAAPLAAAVGGHHSDDTPSTTGALVWLADLVARDSDGHAVDRRAMLRLADAAGLSARALWTVLFDQPQAGAPRRRPESSPLSPRETEALRQLAMGRVYKEIAADLGIATSTVRSSLHSAYGKLGVTNRAHAVLLATEMGWI